MVLQLSQLFLMIPDRLAHTVIKQVLFVLELSTAFLNQGFLVFQLFLLLAYCFAKNLDFINIQSVLGFQMVVCLCQGFYGLLGVE